MWGSACIHHWETQKNIIVAVVVLHNTAIQQNVPMPPDVNVENELAPGAPVGEHGGEDAVEAAEPRQNPRGNAGRERYIRMNF